MQRAGFAFADDYTSTINRAKDAVRQVTQFAHDARELKHMAEHTVHDGVRDLRRTIRRGVHDLEDARDAAAYEIRRSPLKAVALSAGGGLLLGVILGWGLSRRSYEYGRQ